MNIMIYRQKTKSEFIAGFFNAKNFMISLMVATFLVFASGTTSLKDGEELFSIIVGAGLFSVAAGVLIWAKEISNKLYH